MKQKYVYILVLTILTACLALFAACNSTPAIEPPTPYSVSFSVDGEIYRTAEISGTQKVIMPTEPAKEGYIFNGWFLDEGVWSQLFTADAYAYKPIEADVTVYAKYTPIKYVLTYEPGKDMAHANPTEYTVEQHFELQPATKEHYDFVGWFTDAAMTLQTFEIPAGSTGNQTFYAKFEPTQYKAVFMDGETVVAEVPYTVKTKKIIAPEVPEHAGYVGEWEEYELTPGGITVNAKYTAVDYKITYQGVKTSEHKNPAGYNVTKLPLALKEATREHYVFAGWYTDAELTTPITEIAADTTGDLTLYAKWTPVEYKAIFMDGETVVAEIPYTVETEGIEAPEVPLHVGYVGEWEAFEFVMGGFTVNAKYTVVDYTIRYEGVQSEEFDNPEGYNVTDQPIVLGDAVREHYVFVGWFTDPQCTQRITEIAAGMTGDLVLYAKWTPAEYKAVFMDGETVVGEVPFTILTESIEAPEVPAHVGYTGAWEAYELVLGGFTVNAVYTPVDYTITFANTKDVAHVNPSVYNIETETIVLADLYKPGYVFDGWYVGTQRVTEIAQGSTGDVVLTAAWTPIVYGITLHFDPLQGKYSGAANPGSFTADDHVVLAGLTSLVPGYTFDGWYTDKNEGYKVTEIVPETIGEIVLYARFVPIEYTVTYVGVEDGKNFNPGLYTIESAAFNIAPAFRDGYIFGGWFMDEGCSEPAQLHVPTGSMGNIVLYTKWTPVTYVIEYDADGGVLPDNPAVYDITQAITLKAPTKQGFVFKGWFTAKQDGEQVTEILPGTMGNLKLYAQWEPIYYSITYHLFGGENPQMSMSDLLAGNLTGNLPLYTVEIPAVPLFPATKPGYKFEGWYSDPAYTTRVMMINTSACEDVVLYAKWSLETYKVTYVLPEGAAHENVSTFTVLDEIKPLNPATKTGYVFEGWYTDDTYTVRVDNLFGAGVYEDLTLYAKFVPSSYHIWLGSDEDNSHAVVFDLNGAGVSFRQNVTPDQGLTYPAIPTREGYVFAGWYDNAACTGEAYDMSAPVIGDITLYAKWIEASAFISVNAPMQVTLNGVKEHSFTFVPLVDTVITFATTGELDTRGILCDANGNELARNDDASAADKNFKITYSVKAGEAYVITVYGYSQVAQGTTTLSVSGNADVAAGGKAHLPHLYEVASGELYKLPVPEKREGYKFLGWADEDGNFYTNAKGVSLKAWDGTADVVLQEAWEEMYYEVNFDTVGGSAIDSFKLYTGEELDVSKLIPEKTGYKFLGWKLDGELFAQGVMPDHAVTLTAVWEKIVYTITYENTKDVAHDNVLTYTVEDDTIVLADLSKPGYVFEGWYVGDTQVTVIPNGSTGDLVLTAVWSLVEYKATFTDGKTTTEIVYTVETESIEAPAVPKHPGYIGNWEDYELVIGGITVNATYEIIIYNITYENTKDIAHDNVLTYTVEDDTIVLADLSKPGYVFEGWYVGDTQITVIPNGSTGDLVLTAKWTPIVYNLKLHFDLAWGKYTEVTNPLTYTVEDGFALIGLDCLVPGYVFDGWYTEKSLDASEKITELVLGTIGDIELYAHFVPVRYTITYVGAEGAVNANPDTYTVESEAINLRPANKSGYIFGGWYLDEALSVPAPLHIPAGSMGDITLYTKWTPITYVIEYDADGGVLPENPAVYNTTQTLMLAEPTKAGYVFEGWFTDKEEGKQITEILPGTTGNLKLYARWEVINYSVTYHLYGGENVQSNLLFYTVETSAMKLKSAIRPGYKFEGWYADPEHTQQVLTIAGGLTGDVVLYAKWSLETYEVTYVLPEGAEHENVTTFTVLDEIKPLNPATKTGYTFEGWYADLACTQRVDSLFGKGTYGDLTLYAKFTPNQYHIWLGSDEDRSHTVTFDLGDAGESFTQTVTMEQGIAFPAIPTREGYVFAGWFDNAECTGDLFDFSLPVYEDITLYAKWIETAQFIAINTPVQVELNGLTECKFTFISMVDTVITISTKGALDTYGILYDANGKVLLKNDDASSTDKNFQIIYQVAAGEQYTVAVRGFSEQVKGSVILSVNGFATVSAGGKAVLPNLYTVVSDTEYTLSVPEAREGYKFLGWADEDGKFYTDAMGKSLKAWDGTADVVLQEAWEEIA